MKGWNISRMTQHLSIQLKLCRDLCESSVQPSWRSFCSLLCLLKEKQMGKKNEFASQKCSLRLQRGAFKVSFCYEVFVCAERKQCKFIVNLALLPTASNHSHSAKLLPIKLLTQQEKSSGLRLNRS